MTFLDQLQHLLTDIQTEIRRILKRINANKAYVFGAAVFVIGICVFLISKYGKDNMSGMISPLLSLAGALALNFFYTAFKDIYNSREKLEELNQKSTNLEEYKGYETDELIRKQVEGLFNKRI